MLARNATELGLMLRDARKSKGLTQTDLADMVGVSRQWVHSAEHGAPTARIDLMLDALRAVGLIVDVRPETTNAGAHGFLTLEGRA